LAKERIYVSTYTYIEEPIGEAPASYAQYVASPKTPEDLRMANGVEE